MKRAPHRMYARGTRVFVILRDGSRFVDKFQDFNDRRFTFSEHRPVQANEVRTIGPFKRRA